MTPKRIFLAAVFILATTSGFAADRYFGFNNTTSTVFTGVYLAPHGTTTWGPNEALNDKDKTWEPHERLLMKNGSHGVHDLKLVDKSGQVCIKQGVDLSKDTTFDVRDEDLRGC